MPLKQARPLPHLLLPAPPPPAPTSLLPVSADLPSLGISHRMWFFCVWLLSLGIHVAGDWTSFLFRAE